MTTGLRREGALEREVEGGGAAVRAARPRLGHDARIGIEPIELAEQNTAGSPVATANPPLGIAFVSWRDLANPIAGGSELLIHELASGMARRGHEVSLVCGGPTEPRESYRLIRSGGEFSQYLLAPFAYYRSVPKADLVVDVCNGMPFLTPLWHRGTNLCLVNHVHTEQWSGRFNPFLAAFGRTFEAKVMPRVHRKNLLVTISPSTRLALSQLGIPEENIREIPQGVADPPRLHTKSREPMFIACGRLVGYKRIELLLHLWESVRTTTGGKLLVIGDGPDRARLEALNVDGVEFTGFVTEEEKHRLMSAAWVLLHPSSWEGWGLVITEAAIRGTPAVGFDVPGVRDAIVNEQTGILACRPDQFMQSWIQLALDPALREQLATNGIERCQQLSWGYTVEAFEEVAREAVALKLAASRRAR